MPIVKVPLFNPVYRNVDGEELTDQAREHMDCFVDELGFIVKRPGLAEALDLGLGANKPIENIWWWPIKGVALAVCDNKVYKIVNTSGTLSATNITTNGPGTVATPTFAIGVNGNVSSPTHYGIIAAGGAMIEGNGTTTTISNFATIADADAPTAVTHVDFIDNYLVATTGKGLFQFSDLSAPTTWSAGSIATAMRNPDIIRALKVFRRQIFLFGDVTTEIWENDGSPFAPVPGGYLENGIIAPYSVVAAEGSLMWLDDRRHFVSFNQGIQEISTPYASEIADFSAVDDCIGMRVDVRGRHFILWQFPTEGRTLAYNILEKSWSEWSFYDDVAGERGLFLGKCSAYSASWGMQLLGSRTESKIYTFSNTNRSDDGEPIRMKVLTGHINYGTNKRKRCREVSIRAKRGEGVSGGGEAKLLLRYNDDNRGWSNEHELSLGTLSDYETTIRFYPRGVYRTRQYEIVATDNVGVVFGEAYEDFEILGS